MACNADRARTTTATIALVAAGCLAMSGKAAEVAAGEESSDAPQQGWLTQVSPASSWVGPTENQSDTNYADPQYVGAYSEKETVDDSAAPAAGESSSEPARKSWVDADEDQADSGKKPADKTPDPALRSNVASLFRADPQYDDEDYNSAANVDVYGAKAEVDPPRPLLEIGRQQYTSGMYDESSTLLGELNPLMPGLAVYGDWRTAVAVNRNNGKEVSQIATRVNIDVDFKITATERIHAFFTPIQEGNASFSRFEFGRADGDGKFTGEFDINPQTLFFEGDLGSLASGFSGTPSGFDLPFTVGLFPLFLQNGIWANDAILGGAVSIPAKNSAALDLPNFDVTFFVAFDNVDNVGLIGADSHVANLYGVTAFIDAFDGYVETGYALVQGYDDRDDLLVHFLTAAYTRRYYNTVSNSTRVFANFGNDPLGDSDGFAIISENSLITGLPSTLLPYANFFVGFGNPHPLVDGNGAGILKNVGINFETDALTGYPKLDDTGADAWGGAIGLQYLFNLDQQLVFEAAMVQPFSNAASGVQNAQYALGARYQIALDRAWLFRADATYQFIEGEEDNFGLRAEMRRKF